jgi:hypothetical protein
VVGWEIEQGRDKSMCYKVCLAGIMGMLVEQIATLVGVISVDRLVLADWAYS